MPARLGIYGFIPRLPVTPQLIVTECRQVHRMINHSQLDATAAEGQASHHPHVGSALRAMGLTPGSVPTLSEWQTFLVLLDPQCGTAEQGHRDLLDVERERSSYENLFRNSPIPMIQQDYTLIEGWMDELRRQGVLSLREYMGVDLEAIRAVVPMIHVVEANPAAVKAVGLPHEELIGPIDPRIVNAGAVEGWLTQLDAVWNQLPIARAAFTGATAQGFTYDAESILAAPVIDGRPDYSRAVFTIIDVTDHRNVERRMQEIVADKDRFLASVSHEVRTPLTAILGFSELLDHADSVEWLAEEERRSMISSIATHAHEVSDLIEDLLVAARADLQQVEVVSEKVDVVDAVSRTLEAGGGFTEGVTFTATAPVYASCDPVRLRQILRNLLTNAERYGGTGVSVAVAELGDRVLVTVADDGPGLPKAEWERIFQAYHRAHATPGLPGSVGIGLTISRQLAELMGGELKYRHEQGNSVFSLILPLTR